MAGKGRREDAKAKKEENKGSVKLFGVALLRRAPKANQDSHFGGD